MDICTVTFLFQKKVGRTLKMPIVRIDITFEKHTNIVIPVFINAVEMLDNLLEAGLREPADIVLTTPAEAIEFCMSFDGRYAARTKANVQRWLENIGVVPTGLKINENTHVPDDWPDRRL